MATPLISVVIPTCQRPRYLPRAVESVMACQGDVVEVIVVPNGPDTSWRGSLARWQTDHRVRVSPITTANGNIARNHGMSLARGKYIRFLDDDDYLLPAAFRQIALLEESGADVCSGLAKNIDEDGQSHGLVGFPDTLDFICAAVSVSGFTLPIGNLFRRLALQHFSWDESVQRAQDNAWMIDLAIGREWSWAHCDEPVGVWFQHRSIRTSSTQRLRSKEEAIINRLNLLHSHLAAEGRLTPERGAAIAGGLWYYIRRGFPSHPWYWSRVASKARTIDPRSHAITGIYDRAPFRHAHPLLLQWLLLPWRWISRGVHSFSFPWCKAEYRRQL